MFFNCIIFKAIVYLAGVLMLIAAVAVAIAVPLSRKSTVRNLMDQANEILTKAPVIDG